MGNKKKRNLIVGEIDIKSDGFIQLGGGPFTASDIKSAIKDNAIIRNVRANVIEHALWVEDFLDVIIEKVLFPGKRKLVFEDCIYEDLRFGKKGDVFKSIISNGLVRVDNPDEIIRQVKEIIAIRNDFAHGKVFFRRRKMFLQALRGEEIELGESYLNRANNNFRKATDTLMGILSKL